WLWKVLPDHPNVFIDTAWWNPADLIALFTLVAPSQILWASDSPYGLPISSLVLHLRCALQAGLDDVALRSIAGAPAARLAGGGAGGGAGGARVGGGEARGGRGKPLDPLLERVVTHLVSAVGRMFGGGDPTEPLALARLACAVGDDSPHADVCADVLEQLDLF